MSTSEVVVIESTEVRELLRFLCYLDILNKFLLLQHKHSKYMYAKCLNFLCFIKKIGCMHACIVHVSYARLTRDGSLSIQKRWLKRPWLNKYH